jgi:enolase
VGDEGGFAPSLTSNREAVEVVLEAIGKAGYPRARMCSSRSTRRQRVLRGAKVYALKKSGEGTLDSATGWSRSGRTGSGSIRSSRSRTAWPSPTGTAGTAHGELGSRVQLVGDDIFVTNPSILRKGIDEGSATRCW